MKSGLYWINGCLKLVFLIQYVEEVDSVKGIVTMIDHRKQFLAVKLDSDEYSIVEVLEVESPELGDVLSGNLESLGGETLLNLTKGEEIEVFIQDIHADKTRAIKLLRAP